MHTAGLKQPAVLKGWSRCRHSHERRSIMSDEFDAIQFRRNTEQGLRTIAEDTFRALRDTGARSLLQQLVAIALVSILDQGTCKIAPAAAKEIWRDENLELLNRALDPVISHPTSAAQAQALLDQAWTTEDSARILESLLLYAQVDLLSETMWASREWLLVQLRHEVMEWHLRSKLMRVNIVVPSEQRSSPVSARGLLEITTSTSKPLLVAGEEFSVFVTIRNPYEVPVTLYTVETQIPIEFEDVVWKQRRRLKLSASRDDKTNSTRGLLRGLRRITVDRWRLGLHMAAETQPRIAQAVTPTEASELREQQFRVEAQINITSVEGGEVTGVAIDQFQPISVASATPENIDAVLWRIAAFRHGFVPVLLQPGDSVVKQFIFRTNSWLFFRPFAHTLNIEVRYSADGRDHVAAVEFNLVVQAALRATMAGGIIGGIVGGFARSLSQADASNSALSVRYVSIALAAVLSAISVVSLARKSNAQQIVSVEDFWGGLFLGFLVGFFGQQFAMRFLQPGGQQ